MNTLKGPAIFLAQFAGEKHPYNTMKSIAEWSVSSGFEGIQIPSWESKIFNLDQAAESKDYCDDLSGMLKEIGLSITELSTHLQGQLVAVHPAYDQMFDGFAPPKVHGNPDERQKWAVDQMFKAASASKNLGLKAHATFSGALA